MQDKEEYKRKLERYKTRFWLRVTSNRSNGAWIFLHMDVKSIVKFWNDNSYYLDFHYEILLKYFWNKIMVQ